MELRKAELARAMHLLDQMSASVQGGYSLREILNNDGLRCRYDPLTTCGKLPGESCEGCPVWKEIDGE